MTLEHQLIDATGNNVGVVGITDALARAAEAGLDLVEISPNSEPPVCKILDFGKYKYQRRKRPPRRARSSAPSRSGDQDAPNIDIHDYDVKMRSIVRFFEEGDKVKVTLRFRGREMAHMALGAKLLDRVKQDTSDARQGGIGAKARRPANGDGARAALGFLALTLAFPTPIHSIRAVLKEAGRACRGGFHASTIDNHGSSQLETAGRQEGSKCPR